MRPEHDELREYVLGLEIIDTHEHLPAREALRDPKADVLGEYLTHYFSCDLVSAGLKAEQLQAARDPGKPLPRRWKLVEPYWEAARNTGYGRSLDIVAQGLYGLPRIDGATIEALNAAFLAARAAGGAYQRVLKEKSRIRLSILDAGSLDCDRRFFAPALRFDDFITAGSPANLKALARRAGVPPIHTLADLEDACEKTLDDAVAGGLACLKSGLAYQRPLHYAKPDPAAAACQFNSIHAQEGFGAAGDALSPRRALQDHMMHHLCRLADRRGLAFQIHTGIQEGNGNYIAHSDPALLTNLFMEYANVRFDLFHIGYPYQQTLSVLAKNFPNVYIDFAWAHIISPTAATAALVEYLDAVPANKISAFGGDYCFLDGVYGHQRIARQDVAAALAAKIDQGSCDLDRAKELAKMILRDNPVAIFNLAGALTAKPRPAKKLAGRRRPGD